MDPGACPGGECYIAKQKGIILMRVEKFKNNIQTKYMDWVVHGYKFMVSHPSLQSRLRFENLHFARSISTLELSTSPRA